MRRKSAWFKNNFREIKHTFARYLAIFAIIALGVGFFSGLTVTRKAMILTCNDYVSETGFYDFRLISTLGLTDNDVNYFSQMSEVKAAEGSVSVDFIAYNHRDDKQVLKAMSLPEMVNMYTLEAGSLPENPDECLADSSAYSEEDIGTVITVAEENSDDTKDTLAYSEYTITGICRSSLYMNFERGTTNISNGAITAFIYIPEDGFNSDYYTDVYVTLNHSYEVFSDEYENYISSLEDDFQEAVDYRGYLRRSDIVSDANRELSDAQTEYYDGYEQYLSEKQEAENELNSALSQLNSAKREIEKNSATLANTEAQLETARNQYSEGLSQYEEQYAAYQSEKEAQLRDLDEKQAEITANRDTITQGISAIEDTGIISKYGQLQASIIEAEEALSDMDPESEEYAQLLGKLEIMRGQLKAIEDTGVIAQYNELYKNLMAVDAAQEQLDNGRAAAEEAFAQAEAEFQAAKEQLDSSAAQIASGEQQVSSGWAALADAQAQYDAGMAEYEEARAQADEEFAKAEAELSDAKSQLDDAAAEIDDIPEATGYVLTRSTNTGYVSFENDSKIVAGVAKIFPWFFFLVAALVCMTTMTRMVDDQRTLIGTYKALGFSNARIIWKYVSYSGSSALLGAICGFFLGSWLFPQAIWTAYGILYGFTDLPYVIDWGIGAVSLLVALLCSAGATFLSCRSDLKEMPAELIRPRAPKSGKRVLLERIPFIWKHLSFLHKVTIRNIFRYKKRLIMMVLGIGGCTALILTGFGLKDSISGLTRDQFGNIMTYDMTISVSPDMTDEEHEAFREENSDILSTCVFVCADTIDVKSGDLTKDANIIATSDPDITSIINLSDNGTPVPFPEEGSVVLDRALAEKLGYKVGDMVTFALSDIETAELKLSGVFDNYIFNYAIMSAETYTQYLGRELDYSTVYAQTDSEDMRSVAETLMSDRGAESVNIIQDTQEQFDNMISSLNYVVWLIILCAGALAFIVSFNLSNINITERKREIATIKVLGFYPSETHSYVFRENLVLTFIGCCFGLVLGVFLHAYVMSQITVDAVNFNVQIRFISYIYAIILTFVFSVIVDLIMRRKISGINMAESLKSVE